MMYITIDKETTLQLNSLKIALSNKPNLLAKTLNNDKTLVVVIDMINGIDFRNHQNQVNHKNPGSDNYFTLTSTGFSAFHRSIYLKNSSTVLYPNSSF